MVSFLVVLPLSAVLISVLFAYMLLNQWQRRRRIYQLTWFLSVVMFILTASIEVLSELVGWPVEAYRVYLVIAALQVALLGGGTFYLILQKNVFNNRGRVILDVLLLSIIAFFSLMMTISTITDYSALFFGRWEYPVAGIGTFSLLIICVALIGRGSDDRQKGILRGHAFLIFSIIIALWMGVYAAVAEVDIAQLAAGTVVAGQAMAQHVRNFSPLLSVTGGFLLIGGAIFSYIKTRFSFNLWIACGGLTISIAGAIARTSPEFGSILYLGEVIGILLLFKGFIDSDKMVITSEGHPLTQQGREDI
jgi:hypothetical protein